MMEQNVEDEELDLDIEEETPEGGSPEGGESGGDAGELTAEQKRIAELEATNKALASKDTGISDLVQLGRQFLESQNKPQPAAPVDNTADIEAFGEKLQQTILLGNKADVAKLFVEAVDKVAANRVNQELQQRGTPIAERAAEFALGAFLSQKRETVGPNGEKLHQTIAKHFALDPREKAWLATANSTDSQAFLDRKYTEAAGKLLLASSGKAKPKNLSGGSGGGGQAAGPLAFAGIDPKQQRQMEQLAEQFWPDPAVRAEKLKSVKTYMETGT